MRAIKCLFILLLGIGMGDLLSGCNAPGAIPPSTPRPATNARLSTLTKNVRVYSRVELAIKTDGVFANPFDPDQADWWVTFTSPSGQQVSVPAFWYQDFDPATQKPTGASGWRARFTPGEPGRWSAQVDLKGSQVQSRAIRFSVAPSSEAHGFVRIHPTNPHYFAFDDGSLFFPIGSNMGWANKNPIPEYERWLDRLSQNGGNAIRVWMASWGFGIEWKDTGLGDYTLRLDRAWLLDQVFSLAEARGVYIMLSLLNHGAFSERVNPEWSSNPYNAALGGPCRIPQDFVTDPLARQYFKRRLRYIAARWGYSPNLWAWEWWNEVNLTPISDDKLRPWIQEMTAELQTLDPYHHLVTNSIASGVTRLWKMPELSFSQVHDYSGRDPADFFTTVYSQTAQLGPGKPVVMGENGFSAQGEVVTPYNTEAIHLHNGLWAAPFSGFASTAMYWWWDNYIDPLNLWGQYRGIADFLRGEDLPSMTPGKAAVAPEQAHALTLQRPARTLIWIRSDAFDQFTALIAYDDARNAGELTDTWRYVPPVLPDLTVTVTGLPGGEYQVYWYDPVAAQWGAEETISVTDHIAVLRVPALQRDRAAKLVPLGEQRTPGP